MDRSRLYTGKSGQLAVMAEFVIRGYNVAMPEVDVGDDIFVVRDGDGTLWRIQVKTANARKGRGASVAATFNVGFSQLCKFRQPDLIYVFAVRYAERWGDFVVIDRPTLEGLHRQSGLGRRTARDVIFTVHYEAGGVRSKDLDLSRFRNAWTAWPSLVAA
jgi:hypothetical protein